MDAVHTSRFAAGTQAKIKLCGYLKKKRNKVGGWRKMWFVLQDKLLLSYGSKEEYENKLVSFKDVVNLVPGTLVRPLGGFRFTIETTSQTMYTFHCDDRVAYREWITMLLYSLATQDGGGGAAAATAAPSSLVDEKTSVLGQRFRNISLDNIPGSSFAPAVRCATSCISVSRQGATTEAVTAAVATSGCVRLPIAQSTAKILERNGVNPLDINTANSEAKSVTACYACLQQDQHQEQLEHNSKSKPIPKDNSKDEKNSKIFGQSNRKSVCISKSLGQEELNTSRQSAKLMEPVYAVVDLRNKYAQRKIRSNPNLETKRCSSYESLVQNVVYTEMKPEQKAMSSRPSCPDNNIEAIYEDCDSLPQQSIKDDENIYEPIDISAIQKNSSFLDYFNRLKINSVQQFNRFRNKNNDCKCSKQAVHVDQLNKNSSNRKSIKVRLRKLCFKEYEPKPFFKHNKQTSHPSAAVAMPTPKKPKNRWKSVKLGPKNQNVLNDATKSKLNKRIFGSLPHLKRARISLFSNQHFQSS